MSKSGVYLVSATSVDSDHSTKFTSPDDVTFQMASEQQSNGTPFRGMGKEELLRHSSKPFWVKLRMICVSIILLGWLALIITVVALIFVYPKCRDKDARSWWQNDVMYRIYVRSFYDSDGDGNGDLKGIEAKLDYIKDLGFGTISLSPIFKTDATNMDFSIVDHKMVSPKYGTDADLRDLVKKAHDKGMHIVLDFIPNHTSDQHAWFIESQKSADRTNDYRNYYVWADQTTNWNSVYGNTSWDMDTTRNQYYLHQFYTSQPDLNLRSSMVVKELKDIVEHWLITENVDGFYIRNSAYMYEDYDMRNETKANIPGTNEDDYDYYNHQFTYGVSNNVLMLSMLREMADDYSNTSTRFLMADIGGTSTDKLSYFGHFPGSGVHLSTNPFPGTGSCDGKCVKEYTTDWLSDMSTNKWPNWMTGNEDISRFGSRFPANYSKPYYMMSLLLPGTPIVYYGDELGMGDLMESWKPWLPEQPMRGLMQWDNSTNGAFQGNCTSCSAPWINVNSDYTTINVETQTKSDASLLNFITKLTVLRANEAFRYGEYHPAVMNDNIFSFVREFDGVTGYLVAINFGSKAETHDYTSYHSTIQAAATVELTTGSDVGFSVEDEVNADSLTLGPLQGIVVSWDYKAKEL